MSISPPLKRSKQAMRKYLFVFNQTHGNFRFAEFKAVCDLFEIPVKTESFLIDAHMHIFEFETEKEVHQILSRATLLRAVYELFFDVADLDELEKQMREKPDFLEAFNTEHDTWKFLVRPQGKRIGNDVTTQLRERFTPLLKNEKAPVEMQRPKHEFTLIEDFLAEPPLDEPRRVYFGRKIGDGQTALKSRYNLKDRKYIGNSTMDPELAFIQANLILSKPNAIVLDPFSGTGGLLIPAAHFGATVIGTEINYMIARGEGKSSRQGEKFLTKDQNVAANFGQYNLQKFFGDIIIGDASQHGVWKKDFRFDAITADPPYGIREKGSKIGNKNRKEHWTLPSSAHEQHYPEKAKYSLNKVFLDLLNLAADRLIVGGRIAFWFPVLKQTYSDDVLPRHDALEMIENCEQSLTNKGSRRLLVFKKKHEPQDGEAAYVKCDCYESKTYRDGIYGQVHPQKENGIVPNGDINENE